MFSSIGTFLSCHCRIPELYVIGLHFGNVAGSPLDQTDLVQLIREEYITFPILVTHKKFCGVRCKELVYFSHIVEWNSLTMYYELLLCLYHIFNVY